MAKIARKKSIGNILHFIFKSNFLKGEKLGCLVKSGFVDA